MHPILVNFPILKIYSYPLLMGIAWGIAYHLGNYLLLKYGQTDRGYKALFWGTFICSWMGAKIFFLLFSKLDSPANYLTNSSFWLGGGFVFYGGLIFGVLYFFLYSHLLKKFDWKKGYLILPALAFAHAIGRIGCLLAGCCYGTRCSLPWAIELHGALRHPVQLYESILLGILGLILWQLIKRGKRASIILGSYFAGYALIRFCLEFLRGDHVRGIYWWHLSSSQIISLVILFLLAIFYKKWSKQ